MRNQAKIVAILSLLVGLFSGVSRADEEPQHVQPFCEKAAPVVAGVDAERIQRDLTGQGTFFAAELHRRLAAQTPNLVDSPFSIASALGLAALGAQGETAAEIGRALGLAGAPTAGWYSAFGALNRRLLCPTRMRKTTFALANGLFRQVGKELHVSYRNLALKYFGSEVENVDFAKDSEGARQTINAWAARATRQKIQDLLQPRMLRADTLLVIANAVYMQGAWKKPFDKYETKRRSFHLTPQRTVDVPTMYVRGDETSFSYATGPGYTAVSLPLSDGFATFIVIIPNAVDGLQVVEKQWSRDSLDQLEAGLTRRRINLALPRFKVLSQFSLNKVLTDLGVKRAFIAGKADFSGIDGGADHLYISDVVHKAYIDVNESGLEAAAATATVMMRSGRRPLPTTTPIEVKVDRPFLFVIRAASGSVLFMGRVTDPTSAAP